MRKLTSECVFRLSRILIKHNYRAPRATEACNLLIINKYSGARRTENGATDVLLKVLLVLECFLFCVYA